MSQQDSPWSIRSQSSNQPFPFDGPQIFLAIKVSSEMLCPDDENCTACVGHPEAGERSAVIYTLLGSCRRLGINPFDYLKDLFTRLPGAKITQIKEFTPAAWAGANAKEQMVAQAA
jgi:hypothetical protein